MINVDGWTDGRTNGRKLARLCLPAKAGATIKHALMHFELDDDFSSKRIMSQKGHHTGFSHPLKHMSV